ncbi:hypothetical protein CPLU01_12567 [Colletotrichum plurivorum]|uniref:Uncharacterized protein n=1 Tax=Colletotrichum plurivorum TaxID=2175906 RepID=A0A8H6JXW0_9PEZI|nr:hypothetical protein CPLU01_12567 [Colletotrichum plurivorum]
MARYSITNGSIPHVTHDVNGHDGTNGANGANGADRREGDDGKEEGLSDREEQDGGDEQSPRGAEDENPDTPGNEGTRTAKQPGGANQPPPSPRWDPVAAIKAFLHPLGPNLSAIRGQLRSVQERTKRMMDESHGQDPPPPPPGSVACEILSYMGGIGIALDELEQGRITREDYMTEVDRNLYDLDNVWTQYFR